MIKKISVFFALLLGTLGIPPLFAYQYADKEIILQLDQSCANVEKVYASGKLYVEFKPSIHLPEDRYQYPRAHLIKGQYYFVHIDVDQLIQEKGMDLPILSFKGLGENEIAGKLALMLGDKQKENIIIFDVYDQPLRLQHRSGAEQFRFAGLDCNVTTNNKYYQVFIHCYC
ncbi:hypothetical protein [Facilibium subflavum]|uniref:hypothetical protein n=1 Tax=Facilibium subflavum TaxID=2219058 RepID=UPI000E648BCD|nr:hypothetical protein [Facilibium subflavum]